MKEEGVVDMPMRLLIVAAILVFTVPVVLGVITQYSFSSTEQKLASAVEYLKKQIEIVYAQGDNASMVVRDTFPFGTEYVIIGGPLGTDNSHLIRYKLRNGMPRQTIVNYGNLEIIMSNKTNNGTLVVGGTYDFIITKVKSPIDLDHDGLLDDYYIQVDLRHVGVKS